MARIFKSPATHRTPRARAKQAFRDMKQRCENANGRCPAYTSVQRLMTEAEWLEWAVPRYTAFLERSPDDSPCVSRKGDKGHYEIGNLEIISVTENRERQSAPFLLKEDGTKLCSRCHKILEAAQFSKNRSRADGLTYWCRACTSESRKKGRFWSYPVWTEFTCSVCKTTFPIRSAVLKQRQNRNRSGKIACSRSCGNKIRNL